MQPKFSVVLIARNESQTLPRLMGSLKEFQARGGEVLLLDTGSNDNTAEIAKDLGCIVHEVGKKFIVEIDEATALAINKKFVWNFGQEDGEEAIVRAGDRMFDYSGARNYIAQFASNDVIATPDCDEIYTKFDIDKINEAITSGADQLEYNFVYSHDAEGGEMIKFMHCKFYNRKKLQWTNIIHEILTPIAGADTAKRQFLDESIIKLEHWQNPKTDRGHYLTGLAYDCFNNPTNDRNAHYLGRELFYERRFRSAICQLKAHVAMNRWPTEASQSMVHIGDSYLELGQVDEALGAYAKAFDLEPNRREPLMRMAEHYYRTQKPDQALAYAAAALQIKGGDFYANYQPYYEHLPHEILYWALWQKGEVHASKDHFDLALAYQPHNAKYLHDFRYYYELPKMSFVIPTLGRPEGLAKLMKSIRDLHYPEDKIQVILVSDGEKLEWDGDPRVTVVCNEERLGFPKSFKKGVELVTGEWIVFAANDMTFDPDAIMFAFKQALDNRKYFMAFNSGYLGPDEGNICEHFMIHKKIVPQIGGEVFDTDFHHVGVDNLLWAKMKKLGQAMRCPRAIVHHDHFSTTPERVGKPMDEVSKLAYKPEDVEADRKLLAEKLLALESENSFAVEFKG